MKIKSEDGSRASFWKMLVRHLSYLISAWVFYLGFIAIAFDRRKQGWHDKLAKTVVVKESRTKTGLLVTSLSLGLIISIISAALIGVILTRLVKIPPTPQQNMIQNEQNQYIKDACFRIYSIESIDKVTKVNPQDQVKVLAIAINDLKTAVAEEPKNARAYRYLALVYERLFNLGVGRADEWAAKNESQAESIDPSVKNMELCR